MLGEDESIMDGDVIGYIMMNDRYQDKYSFDGTTYKIARFIIRFGQGKAVRIIITNLADNFLRSIYKELLDQIVKTLFNEIITELSRLQRGKAYERMSFIQIEPYVMKLPDEG